MSFFSEWPENWYGPCKLNESDPFNVPVFSDMVDLEWHPEDKEEIVRYLKEADAVLASPGSDTRCFVCGESHDRGTQRSDGTWLWINDLVHLVDKHGVRLPDRMVDHIRSVIVMKASQ